MRQCSVYSSYFHKEIYLSDLCRKSNWKHLIKVLMCVEVIDRGNSLFSSLLSLNFKLHMSLLS